MSGKRRGYKNDQQPAGVPPSNIPSMPRAPEFVVRKAGMQDIAPILGLINGYAAKGIMLPRTELEVSEDIGISP